MDDVFDAGLKGDKFALISLMNKKCLVKVKTPVGDTDRFELNRIEMQGTVPVPLKCSVQIDTLHMILVCITIKMYVQCRP